MKHFSHRGFTLLEFIVVISIFAIMAAVALINFSGFRSNVGLTNLTHDIALTIRQAQVFGWSTSTAALDISGEPLRYSHGVFFPYVNNAFNQEFFLYTKTNPDPNFSFYSQGIDTLVDTIKIQGPYHISDIRTAPYRNDLKIDPQTRAPFGGVSHAGDISIAFSRPRPEASFFLGGSALLGQGSNYMGIYIVSDTTCPSGVQCLIAEHVIIISRFGEITVQ